MNTAVLGAAAILLAATTGCLNAKEIPGSTVKDGSSAASAPAFNVSLGSRPLYLIDRMPTGKLKNQLLACADKPVQPTDFFIGHRGAPLLFPEHTRESYQAAAVQGAGIVECDVTFTKDRELVCRHAQCDLHTTTNILASPLAAKCSEPFSPATFDPVTGERLTAASARCCTSDITLAEFKTLEGKMDAADGNATTVEQYLGGTADFRTDLYATGGTLLSHKEAIALFERAGVKHTPELKSPQVEMPFQGDYTQADYAQQMIDDYRDAGVNPQDVWAQSFNLQDVLYWIDNEPAFGQQAVYLDSRVYADPTFEPSAEDFAALRAAGVNIVAPPMFALVTSQSGKMVPSEYASLAQAAGLDIITWTLERSGRIVEDVLEGGNTFYYQSTLDLLTSDADILHTLHVLAQDVGIIGIFTDWPATVTYYANCLGL